MSAGRCNDVLVLVPSDMRFECEAPAEHLGEHRCAQMTWTKNPERSARRDGATGTEMAGAKNGRTNSDRNANTTDVSNDPYDCSHPTCGCEDGRCAADEANERLFSSDSESKQ